MVNIPTFRQDHADECCAPWEKEQEFDSVPDHIQGESWFGADEVADFEKIRYGEERSDYGRSDWWNESLVRH